MSYSRRQLIPCLDGETPFAGNQQSERCRRRRGTGRGRGGVRNSGRRYDLRSGSEQKGNVSFRGQVDNLEKEIQTDLRRNIPKVGSSNKKNEKKSNKKDNEIKNVYKETKERDRSPEINGKKDRSKSILRNTEETSLDGKGKKFKDSAEKEKKCNIFLRIL